MSNLFNYDVLSYVMEHVDSDTLRCCLLVSHEWNAAASYEGTFLIVFSTYFTDFGRKIQALNLIF